MGVILVVDNDGETARSVADALTGWGGIHAILERRTGGSGLSVLLEGIGIDVAVIDEHLADMSGMELLRSLRRLSPRMPVIMVGSVLSAETYLKAMHAGVFDFLARPVDQVFLRRVITTAMEEEGYFQTAVRVTGRAGATTGRTTSTASRTSS